MSRSSPTVHLNNVFILLGYNTTNSINICSLEVEGAFLEADLPDPIYIKLGNDILNVIKKLSPNLIKTNGCGIVRLKKALYGLVTKSKTVV